MEGEADSAAGLGEGACSGCDSARGEQTGGDGWSPETPPSMKMSMDGFQSHLPVFFPISSLVLLEVLRRELLFLKTDRGCEPTGSGVGANTAEQFVACGRDAMDAI